MKVRLLYICVAVMAVTAFAGCKKWLDVQPVDRISGERLFESSDGFRNAVNGVYQKLSAPELYGRNLTWGLASAIALDYQENTIPPVLQAAANLDFSTNLDLISLQSQMWSSAFNVIANCNRVIQEASVKDSTFFTQGKVEQDLIIGEMKAVRALLHFDMLRFFAPAPALDMNGRYVPYQSTYPAHASQLMSTRELLEKITKDLTDAEELVAANDTLPANNYSMMANKISSQFQGTVTSKWGQFFNYRMYRMNYVAIKALEARVYLYAGDRVNAKKAAEFVYANYGPAGRLPWYTFTPAANSSGDNRYSKLINDMIMCGYDPNLLTAISSYRGTFYTYKLGAYITQTVMPSTGRDNRQGLINYSTNISYKWQPTVSTTVLVTQQVTVEPILRMTEIYYIYSECLYEEGQTTQAIKVLNEVRQGRGYTNTISPSSRNAFYSELLDEYRREFFEDGQTVFAFKRLNMDVVAGTVVVPMSSKFTLPLPDSERNF